MTLLFPKVHSHITPYSLEARLFSLPTKQIPPKDVCSRLDELVVPQALHLWQILVQRFEVKRTGVILRGLTVASNHV